MDKQACVCILLEAPTPAQILEDRRPGRAGLPSALDSASKMRITNRQQGNKGDVVWFWELLCLPRLRWTQSAS